MVVVVEEEEEVGFNDTVGRRRRMVWDSERGRAKPGGSEGEGRPGAGDAIIAEGWKRKWWKDDLRKVVMEGFSQSFRMALCKLE